MKKLLLFLCTAILSGSAAFAQTEEVIVYDAETGQEERIDLDNIDTEGVPADETDYAKENTLIPATIVGPDNRINLTGKAAGYEKAGIILTNQGVGRCSGAMVGSKYVLTAAHCVAPDGRLSDASKITVTAYGLPDAPSAKAKKILVYAPYATPKRKKQLDFAIIVLNSNLGNKTGWLTLSVLQAKQLQDLSVYTIGAGEDKPKGTIWKSPGKIGKVSKHFVFSDIDIQHGNSGGVIIQSGTNRIVAVATTQVPIKECAPNIVRKFVPEQIQECIADTIGEALESDDKEFAQWIQELFDIYPNLGVRISSDIVKLLAFAKEQYK